MNISVSQLRNSTRSPCVRISRRFSSTHLSNSAPAPKLHNRIRALLRETAQPVAVVTCFMPSSQPPSLLASSASQMFHGATLSSFTSISMSPYPLVAFSLRVPSRTATALSSALNTPLCINLLSAPQSSTARTFSRPDLHPRPFETLQWSSTKEGLPTIHGSLGALSCRLVGSAWPLHDLDALGSGSSGHLDQVEAEEDRGDGVASELFIARVIRVEEVPSAEGIADDASRALPLLYHRRTYATAGDIPPCTETTDY